MQAFLRRVYEVWDSRFKTPTKYILIAGAIFLFTGLYYWGAFQQAESVNTNLSKSDQSAYMDYAKDTVDNNFADIGGRNRMPLYPILLSLVYTDGINDEVFFQRGKLFNIVLSIFALLILTLISLRYLSRPYAFSLIAIVAFTVFIFKAGFVQAEILFYTIFFISFLLLVRLICKPSLKLAVVTGVAIGFAHLTKASVLPLLALGVFSLLVQQFANTLRDTKADTVHRTKGILQGMVPAITSASLLVLFFLITVFPYIQNSRELFGQYFYNVNSTFYFWYDSWEEVTEGTKAFGDRVGWPEMPTDEIPSLENYLLDHSGSEIVERLNKGITKLWDTAITSYGYYKYGIAYLFVFLVLAASQFKRARELLREHIGLGIFFFAYIIGYLILSAWFVAIAGKGDRLILAHFLPLMFSLSYFFANANKWFSASTAKALNWLNVAVFIAIPIDIYQILTERIFDLYGGK